MAALDRLLTRRPLQFLAFLIAAISVCLLAVQPFTLNRMPQSADGLLQMYRALALEHSLAADSALWPRYSSGLVYGYGAPLFNYFTPLSYLPATWLHRLGLDFVQSWLLLMVLYTLVAALGVLELCRFWTRSNMAGWVASLAYIYAPYFLFDSVTRGTSPEVAALAILPFVLLGFTRLAFYGGRRDFLIAVLAYSLFIPLHTLITLHGTALLALYCLFLVWRAAERRAVFLRLVLAGALALSLTAFYWLPALLETNAIKLDLITEQLADINVTRHLLPLGEILALPHRADPTQQNQAVPISLGWSQLILSAAGLLLSFRSVFRQFRALMLFLAGIVVLLVFMNTPASAFLWETLPLIGYTQFPWRLLGLASLLLALMTGIGIWLICCSLPAGRWRMTVIAAVTALLMLSALPWTYTAYHGELPAQGIRDVQQFERASGQLALSSYAEYLPINSDARQLDPHRLRDQFAAGDVISRLSKSDTLEIMSEAWTGTSANLRLHSTQEQTLELDWLYVPGWTAEIDGQGLTVFASPPAGLVALEVPAGEFDLHVSLQPTATQMLSLLISALGVVGVLALLLAWRLLPQGSAVPHIPPAFETHAIASLVAISLLVFLFKTLLLDKTDNPFKAARFAANVAAPALANFGNQIDLLAADMPTEPLDQPKLSFKLYWRLNDKPLSQDFSSIIRMRDAWGQVIAEASSFAPGGLATNNWLPGTYVEDVIFLEIPPYTPPLDRPYYFDVSLFDAESLLALSLINAAGNPQDVKYQLGSRLYRPSERERQAEHLAASAVEQNPAAIAALYQAPFLPAAATVGDELRFNWVWQKSGESPSDLRARLLWLDEAADVAGASEPVALVKGFNMGQWRLGEVYRGHQAIIVPAVLAAGSYAPRLQLLDDGANIVGDMIDLEQLILVSVPARQFEQPDLAVADATEWDNGIVLQGYRMDGRGGLELVWATQRVLPESLRLFVHILNDEGMFVTQWDGVPVDWTRPTSGWLPGEFVTTAHNFPVPAGEYQVRLGWYRPASGERIAVGKGDALLLDEIFRMD